MNILITGGLGLVGANYANHCLSRGDRVIICDNNTRGESNVRNEMWLRGKHRDLDGRLQVFRTDIADRISLGSVFNGLSKLDAIVHAAAQSSVDLSMLDPEKDFYTNVVGTFNLLDLTRLFAPDASFIFMASNKVYDVAKWPVEKYGETWKFLGRSSGPGEAVPYYTDAREPYGASKICGFYYTRCYATMYALNAVVTVPSGMTGPRQFGREEQGWLAWMAIATQLGLTFTIRGDGYQVRDMLHVDDVNSALDLLIEAAPRCRGEIFNLGGGPRNAISLVQAQAAIESNLKKSLHVRFEDWRPHDNKCYISNVGKLIDMGWYPKVDISEAIRDVCEWVKGEEQTLKELYGGRV